MKHFTRIVDLYLLVILRIRLFLHYIVVVLVIDFRITNGQKIKTATAFMNRLCDILKQEHIEYDKKVIAELIQRHYPDFRRTINELQRYSVRGKIDSGILVSLSDINNKELVKLLKEKRFTDMRKWVVQKPR